MDDLISRQAVLKICRRYWHPTYNPIMEEVEKLPSTQSEIIRCKECKYYRRASDGITYCYMNDSDFHWQDNDYCSRGEKR